MRQQIRATIGRLWHDRSGVTAVLTAFGAVILMGFTGLAVDVVNWELVQHKMQSAADAAALAGSIADYAGQNVSDAVDAVSASYGFANNQGGTTVTVTAPVGATQVQVVIAQPQTQYFSRLLLASAPTVRVQAAANLPAGSGKMCVMALGQNGTLDVGDATFIGNATVNLNNCDLYNDSNNIASTQLNGQVTLGVRNMYLAGDYTVGGTATLSMSGMAATYVTPAADPYASMKIPSYSGCDQTNFSVGSNQTATLTPGVYCGGMTIQGTANLQPGTYIIDGGNLNVSAQATMTGTGVTIILTSHTGANYGAVNNINGGATVSLTAPTAGATLGVPGIVLWVDRNAPLNTDSINGGSSQIINGVVYMPSQQVSYNGGSSAGTTCLQIIGLSVAFAGTTNSYVTQSGCSADNIPIKQPPLPPTLAS